MAESDTLQWNDERTRCAVCSSIVEPQTGYRFYADDGPQVLCASCYQSRLMDDDGGRTHDLIAEVDGGSG